MKDTPARTDVRLLRFLLRSPFQSLAPAWRYGLAILIVLGATTLRVALIPWTGGVAAYNIAFLSIIVTKALLGTGPALLSVVVALGGAEFFVVGPIPGTLDGAAVERLATSAVVGVLMVAALRVVRVAGLTADETLRRLAAVEEATFEAIVESESGRIVNCNEQFARMTGRPLDQLEGMSIFELVAPEDRPRVQANIRPNRESVIEHGLIRADGTRLQVEAHGTPLSRGSRRLTGVRDITERRRAEAALERSVRQYSTMFNATSDGVWLNDLEGRILEVNDAYCRMSGYSRAELNGMPVAALDVAEGAEGLGKHVRGILDKGGHDRFESRHRRKDGSVFDVDVTALHLERDERIAIFVRDITSRKRYDQERDRRLAEIREREAELRLVMNTVPALMSYLDTEFRYRRVNETYARWFGLAPGDIEGRHPREIIGDAAWDLARPRLEQAMAGETVTYEEQMPYAAGGTRWTSGTFMGHRDATGQVQGVIALVQDITERKRMEEVLRDANRRKDEFIAMLSHELRNPLAPIRYALPLLRAERFGETGRAAIAVIDRQSEHLTRLVDDLLEVSRITGGKIELRRKPVTLASIAEAAAEAAAPAVAAGGHTLTTTLPTEPVWLHADGARLVQVVTNLLDNAAKYTPPGGTIALQASRSGDAALIRVRDNGIGIPPEALPNLFEMFWQVNRPDKPQGGLGIGLALAKRLVEMHGGTIEAESAGVRQGAEFLVRLPVVPQPAEEVPAPRVPRGVPRRLKVLLVDDNADLVEMLAVAVQSAGHEVRKASDGPGAVSAALSYRPDVVLLDLGLPVTSGMDVARELRRRPETAATRLVALTGWGQQEDRRATEAAGFDHHLTKPTDPDVLLDLLCEFASATPA